MGNHEVTELTWENGQLTIHGLGGLLSHKPTWGGSNDTLESIVHQATSSHNNQNSELLLSHHYGQFEPANTSSTVSFSIERSMENKDSVHVESSTVRKRMRLEPDQYKSNFERVFHEGRGSASAGGSVAFSRENDATTLMNWTSLEENPLGLKANNADEDSACHDGSENMDQEEQRETKGETSRSNPTRRNRAAANHNQSERRRRDRINQKMKALQRLVPNASKSDKASMLDEVIEYLKQLQAQVKMMNTRSIPQMMMPTLEMQQHMQMSLLAPMGMGIGLGISHTGNTATQPHVISPAQIATASTSQLYPPPFMVPQMISNISSNATTMNNSAPFSNPYCPYFAPPMNMDFYNKMAAIYRQQINQTNHSSSNPLPHNNVQR